MPILPHDALVTAIARERWITWKEELHKADLVSPDCPAEVESNVDPDAEFGLEYEEQARRKSRAEHVRDMHASIPSRRRGRTPLSGEPRRQPGLMVMTDAEPSPRSRPSTPSRSPLIKRETPDRSSSPDVRQDPNNPGSHRGGGVRSPTVRLGQGHGIYAGQLSKLSRGVEEKAVSTGHSETAAKAVDIVWHDGPSDSDRSSLSSTTQSLELPSASPSPPPYAALQTPLPPSESPSSSSLASS